MKKILMILLMGCLPELGAVNIDKVLGEKKMHIDENGTKTMNAYSSVNPSRLLSQDIQYTDGRRCRKKYHTNGTLYEEICVNGEIKSVKWYRENGKIREAYKKKGKTTLFRKQYTYDGKLERLYEQFESSNKIKTNLLYDKKGNILNGHRYDVQQREKYYYTDGNITHYDYFHEGYDGEEQRGVVVRYNGNNTFKSENVYHENGEFYYSTYCSFPVAIFQKKLHKKHELKLGHGSLEIEDVSCLVIDRRYSAVLFVYDTLNAKYAVTALVNLENNQLVNSFIEPVDRVSDTIRLEGDIRYSSYQDSQQFDLVQISINGRYDTSMDILRTYKIANNKMLVYQRPNFSFQKVIDDIHKEEAFDKNAFYAMLMEKNLDKTNFKNYTEVAKALYVQKKYDVAIDILSRVREEFSSYSLVLLYLADCYWGKDHRHKAKKLYKSYVEKSKGLKIPKRVQQRLQVKVESPLDNGFKQVHKKVLSLGSLVTEKTEHQPKFVETIPWKQKILLTVDKGELQKVIPFDNNGKVEFYYIVLANNDLKLYLYDEDSQKGLLLDSYYQDKQEFRIHTYDLEAYHVRDGYLYFYIQKEDKIYSKLTYKYRYKLGSKRLETGEFVIAGDSWMVYNFENRSLVTKSHPYLVYETKEKRVPLVKISGHDRSDYFIIGTIAWSPKNRFLYFDNHGESLACIWRYDTQKHEIIKIVPEHEAHAQTPFIYKGVEHIVYIEENMIKLAKE